MNEEKQVQESGEAKAAMPSQKTNRKRRNNIIAIVVAVIVVLAALFGTLYKTNHLGPITGIFTGHQAVAYVNGEKITRNELNERFAPLKAQIEATDLGTSTNKADLMKTEEQKVLSDLINEKLLLDEANKAGVTVTDQQVNDQYNTAKQQYETQAQAIASSSTSTAPAPSFEDQLDQAGFTPDEYRQELQKELIITTYLSQKLNLNNIQVTDAETQALYDQYASQPGVDKTQIPAYADVKDSLETQVLQQKQQAAVQQYLTQIRDAAKIQVLI